MELILILLILNMQNKNGTSSLDLKKLTSVLNAFAHGDNDFINLPILKNLDVNSLLNGNFDLNSIFPLKNGNLSDIIDTISAFSTFSKNVAVPEKSQSDFMPPLKSISKIANENITNALNSYFSE